MSSSHTHKHDHVHSQDHPAHDHPEKIEESISICGIDGCGSLETGNPTATSDNSLYRHIFKVQGLDCVEEVATLKKAVGPMVGGDDQLAFDVLNGRMMILKDATGVSSEDIRKAVGRTGMKATEWQSGDPEAGGTDDRDRRVRVLLTALSGLSVLAGFSLHAWRAGGFDQAIALFADHGGQAAPLAEMIAYGLAIVFGARYVVVKAWYSARSMRPDIHLLMVIAVTGAIAINQWFEAAIVTFLFALSLVLESWSVGRARRAIEALLDLSPPVVRLKLESGEEREVAVADAPVGSLFIVKPGERFPLDGKVISGASAVNQAPITGESVPVVKEPDSTVFAGTINGDGALEIESTKAAADTTLSRIIRMIEQAQSRRAKSEQWVEKFARIYTPAVIVLAFAVFLIPPLMFSGQWDVWFYRALVLLVIACPCALVISTPVSIVASLAASARMGVLVKGGSYIELPAHLKALALDKTGTLTRGEPNVVGIVPLNNHSEDELLERAAALEARSTHPLARAILDEVSERQLSVVPAENVQILPGKGATGLFDGEEFWLGSHRYLLDREQDSAEITAQANKLERAGRTVVVIGNDNHVCGLIALADTLRPQAREMILELRAAGVEHVIMLTGDNQGTAEAIASETGVDEIRAELLPEDKVQAVEELVDQYGVVAMVGDGVNDAPAMARASFGIAMGAMGTDAAIETADIALMTDDLSKLPWLIRHSRRTLGIIHQNIAFSLGVKLVFVVLTFTGFASLWGAIAADVGASLLVVANALRLLRPSDNPGPGQNPGLRKETVTAT